jgi:hypothetical protein
VRHGSETTAMEHLGFEATPCQFVRLDIDQASLAMGRKVIFLHTDLFHSKGIIHIELP